MRACRGERAGVAREREATARAAAARTSTPRTHSGAEDVQGGRRGDSDDVLVRVEGGVQDAAREVVRVRRVAAAAQRAAQPPRAALPSALRGARRPEEHLLVPPVGGEQVKRVLVRARQH